MFHVFPSVHVKFSWCHLYDLSAIFFIRACEQNSQTQFKPAGLLTKIIFIVSVIVFVHHLRSGFAKHFFLLSKNELYTKLQKERCRIKHKDQSCPCAGWCAATYSFFELQLKRLALILTPRQISTLSGEGAIIKRSCFFCFFYGNFFFKRFFPHLPLLLSLSATMATAKDFPEPTTGKYLEKFITSHDYIARGWIWIGVEATSRAPSQHE